MIKIANYPGVLRDNLEHFEDIFTKPQLRHFSEYLTGLIVCEKVNIKQINNSFIGHCEYSNKDRFMTESNWSIDKVNQRRIDLIQNRVSKLSPSKCYLVIDDTLLEKTGKNIPEVGKFYDHASKRYVLAHNIVTSQYVTPLGCFPIDYKLYLKRDKKDKEFKTKIAYAKELVDGAIKYGLPFNTVIFDAWYLAKELCQHVENKGRNWLGTAKSNRIVYDHGQRISLQQFRQKLPSTVFRKVEMKGKIFYCFTKTMKMSKLGKVRLLISHENEDLSDEPRFLVTNNLRWEAKRIVRVYSFRWSIETFYRDSKQNLGIEDYAMRDLVGIKRHWYLVFLSYCLLALSSMDGILRKWFDANVRTIGEKCHWAASELLQDFIFWVVNKAKEQNAMEDIIPLVFAPKAKLGKRFKLT